MQEQNSCRKLTLHKPEGAQRVDRPAARWLDSAEEDLMTIGVRKWRRKSEDRDHWRAIIKGDEVHHGLYRPQKKKKRNAHLDSMKL
jgi:hypothetical protein